MSKTITTEVFTFEELNEKAKAKACDWYRENGFDYDWYDSVYEDAKTIGALMGITITNIYFSGFSSQGDGACFECSFEGKEGAAKEVMEHAPKDDVLHHIAMKWEALQKAHGYNLSGNVRQQGHGYHDQCTRVYVQESKDGEVVYEFDTDDSMVRNNEEPGAQATRILRELMRWLYRQLEKEYDYLTSDEEVAQMLIANEYTFTAEGKYYA